MEKDHLEALIVKKFAVIILAAGSSSRLGSPKQLLIYHNKTLLQNCIDHAKRVQADPIILVLGAHKEHIKDQIDTGNITVIENTNWETGMASSITSAVRTLQVNFPYTDGLILMVCDQPFADWKVLSKLLQKQKETGKALVASSYEGIHGTPAFFHRSMFHELLNLKGDTGARKIIEKYSNRSAYVSFKAGSIDIDTSEDYKNLAK